MMQYILSQAEYDDLLSRKRKAEKNQVILDMSPETLQDMCTHIANVMPVIVRWRSGPDRPWGCILNKYPLTTTHYCDECPVQKLCPNQGKEYSQ